MLKFLGWTHFPIRKKARKQWMASSTSLMWVIWEERNMVVFEDALVSFVSLKISFLGLG